MKLLKYCGLILCLIFIFQPPMAVAVMGEEESAITFSSLKETEKTQYIEFFALTNESNAENYKEQFIYSFDVSEEGDCVIFLDDATVVIMDSDGEVKRILKFKNEILRTRTPFNTTIQWDGDNINLLLGYGLSCIFTNEGEIVDVFRYETTLRSLPNKREISIGEDMYTLGYSNWVIHFLGGKRYDFVKKSMRPGSPPYCLKVRQSYPA